jgi:hypothetical protein
VKIVATPEFLARDYPEVAPTRLIESGPCAGMYAHCVVMLYTVGIAVSDPGTLLCRWCYETRREAAEALEQWDGQGDPPGNWIKFKGRVERHGPGSTAKVRDE